MSELELTRDLLMDAGGWKEMKEARRIHRSGLVEEARYEDGVLTGVVRGAGKPTKVRMKILSRTHMENKCTCFLARRDGRVCAHAIAVGLEVIEPTGKQGEEQAPEVTTVGEVESRWPAVRDLSAEEEGAGEEFDGLPVTCEVMLPLKVEGSWERGQLMVGVGVSSGDEQQLLAAFGPEATLLVGERDGQLLRALRSLFPAEPPGVMTLDQAGFLSLLDGLVGHPRVRFGKKGAAHVSWTPLRPQLGVRGRRISVRWPEGAVPLQVGERCWVLDGDQFRPVAPGLPARYLPLFEGGLVVSAVEALSTLELLENWFELDPDDLSSLPQPVAPVVELELEGSLRQVGATMRFSYGAHRTPAGAYEATVVEDENGGEVLTDPALERAAVDALRQFGFEGPERNGRFVLRDEQAILRFYAHGVGRLDPEWKLIVGERFAAFRQDVIPITPVFDYQGSGEDWFAMEMEYRAGEGVEIPREEVQRLLQTGRNDRPLSGGRVAVLDPELEEELRDTIADCDPGQEQPGIFRIDHRQAAYLRQAATDMGVAVKGGSEGITHGAPEPDLGNLADTLRPYQAEGVVWLWKLSELGMGGILADDMGLGKTLQTLAFLRARGGRSLVVCPSSLVSNWLAEAERFVPEIKAVAIVGPKRQAVLADSADAGLLVTSYALLRLDEDLYRDLEFEVVVLDEAQQIKNPEAQVTKAANRLQARHRFALTGTPLENSVRDLWSIMNFVMPGYLGAKKAFAERFEKPLARGGDPTLQRRLARRIRPVLLRRLKQEVATDLPEKIEQVRYCELTKSQRQVYQSILQESRSLVHDAEGGRKRMVALTALLRLRQACCDLRLLGLPDVDPEDSSIKLAELEELLAEAVAGGHRVLVFSQFVQLLQALVPLLAESQLDYCYLDGRTRNRGEVVARFQESEIPVFLISLKAGGVGLNLTGADTVIHLDPWWNPAVEAQATDRAHRIGQQRVVTSYKLITKGTVEEKILALQERKREMITATLDADLPAGVSALSEQELFELFG